MMALSKERARIRLSRLLEGLAPVSPGQDRWLTGVTLDSREIGPGGLFCACGGARRHGLDFAAQAIARGAAAIVCEADARWRPRRIEELRRQLAVPLLSLAGLGERVSLIASRFYGEPSRQLRVIGVTGTNGKTSICHFLAQALAPELRCGIVGTLGNGFPGELVPSAHTTPDAVNLQAGLAALKARGATAVAMEVSSHALDQGRVAAVHFHTAVFTNLTRDHLDYHPDMASYAAAKRRLFRGTGLRYAVLNRDDPYSDKILGGLDEDTQPLRYGLTPPDRPLAAGGRWLQAYALEAGSTGMRFRVTGSEGEGELASRLLGRFNVSNLLAAIAVLVAWGVPLARALADLSRVRGVPGRMQLFERPGQPRVVVDYAHTPDALAQVLTSLRAHVEGRLVCLFGCGGERDRGKRPQMGALAERLSDRVWISDDNPRHEDGDGIVRAILAGMSHPQQARVERNRALAIRAAIAAAAPEDLVLVAGKGHETSQQLGDLRLDFSDREQVLQVLKEGAHGRL